MRLERRAEELDECKGIRVSGNANVYKSVGRWKSGFAGRCDSGDLGWEGATKHLYPRRDGHQGEREGGKQRASQLVEHWLGGTRREEDAFQTPRLQTQY